MHDAIRPSKRARSKAKARAAHLKLLGEQAKRAKEAIRYWKAEIAKNRCDTPLAVLGR